VHDEAGRALVATGPGALDCRHRVSSFNRGLGSRAVGADVDNRVDERAVTQDDLADTALGQCSEGARRLPDTETRSKGSAGRLSADMN
jgi:hypothetical protein